MSAGVLKAPVHLYKRQKSSEISTACVLHRLTPTVENMVLEITALSLLNLTDKYIIYCPNVHVQGSGRKNQGVTWFTG